jgi:alanine dehydrogenase
MSAPVRRRAMMGAMSRNAPAIRTVGVPRETKTAEHRVAMTPDGVRELERHGVEVVVETAAGEGASITDDDYRAAGATIVSDAADAWAQEMVVKVKEPNDDEFAHLRDDLTLFTYLHLAAYPEVAKALSPLGRPRSPTRRCSSPTGRCPCSRR